MVNAIEILVSILPCLLVLVESFAIRKLKDRVRKLEESC